MKHCIIVFCLNVVIQTLGHAQTAPTSLQVTTYLNITSASTLDGAGYIDNRSTFIRHNNYHGFFATGTGTWSVTMQFADGSPSGFTSFGTTAVVTNAGSPIGYGTGYHDYIKFVFTGTATVSAYSASKDFWYPAYNFTQQQYTFGGNLYYATPPTFINAGPTPLGSGDNVLYTCLVAPCIVLQAYTNEYASSGTTSYYAAIKHGGTTFRRTTILSAANYQNLTPNGSFFVLQTAGDQFIINKSGAGTTNGGVSVADGVILDPRFDIQCMYGLASGNQTLFTVPTGKTSQILGQNINAWGTIRPSLLVLTAGTAPTGSMFLVPFGSSPSNANVVNGLTSSGSLQLPTSMNSGDTLVLSLTGGTPPYTDMMSCVAALDK